MADEGFINKRLAEAEFSIATGKLHVMKQELLIEQLAHDGLDTVQAEAMLASFRASLQAREDDRDLILAQLKKRGA